MLDPLEIIAAAVGILAGGFVGWAVISQVISAHLTPKREAEAAATRARRAAERYLQIQKDKAP